MAKQSKPSTYNLITDRIIELLEQGTVPWRKPWSVAGVAPTNLKSSAAYRGINTFLLACAPYASPYWVTFKQAKAMGGSVKKGEKGWPVVFWKWLEKDEGAQKSRHPLIRRYTVFNAADQCEGLVVPQPEELGAPMDPIVAAEDIVSGFENGPTVSFGGGRAFYQVDTDSVVIPDPCSFEMPEEFYSTLFHELGHASGAPKRLGRFELGALHFGSSDYSKEELVAEMVAAFLSGQAGIEQGTLDNSAAYISGWLRRLRDDNRFVVQAAAQAQKAADLILGRTFGGAGGELGNG